MFCEDDIDTVADHCVNGSPRSQLRNTLQRQDDNRRVHDLCSVCNQNQLLKVKQLANFVPQNEV